MTIEYTMEDVVSAGKTALISFVLYMIDPFSVFFSVPLHYQGIRKKNHTVLLFSVVLITAAVAVREVLRYRGTELKGEVLVFFILGFGMPVVLSVVTGAFYLLRPMGFARRLTVVLGSAGVLGIVMIMLFERSNDLSSRTAELLAGSLGLFFPEGSAGVFSTSQFAAAAIYTFQRTFLLVICMQFGIGFSAAWEIYKRSMKIGGSLLDRVRFPEKFIWILLPAWTLILLDIIAGIGIIGIIGWNAGLVAALAYVLQGLAIFREIVNRRRNTPISGFRLCILLGLVMFIPGINMITLTALGILGVTEIWIVYRYQVEQGDDNESHFES